MSGPSSVLPQLVTGAVSVTDGTLTASLLNSAPGSDTGQIAVPVRVISSLGSAGGGLTDTQLRASPVPVSGTFWQATQPVSGTVGISGTVPVSGTFWQATQPVSIATMPSTPVTGTFWQTTQPVSIAASVTVAQATASSLNATTTPATPAASANTHLNVSLGSSTGKANVMKTGSLASSATTADQVILTYTVTAGKTFYLEYASINVRLTTFAATATNFGTVSLENPSGTKVYTDIAAGTGVLAEPILLYFAEPIPIAAASVIRLVCTPSAATAFTWQGNFGGYER